MENETSYNVGKNWTPELDDRLIDFCLYDITSTGHSNRVMKKRALDDMSAALAMSDHV